MTTEYNSSTVNSQPSTDSDEISLKELIEKLQSLWKYLLTQWMKIVVIGLLGGVIGFVYAYRQPVKYIAKMTFVVEDAKSSGGGLASLAGQFGFDIGGGGGGSIFSGDNILLFLKSESLIKETLLTPYHKEAKMALIDKYLEGNDLKINRYPNGTKKDIYFYNLNYDNLTKQEDSTLQLVSEIVINNDLIVSRPDKKSSFIEIEVTMSDELLCKLFTERFVETATLKYISSKTKTKLVNVQKLEKKADSLFNILNDRTYSSAITQQQLVDFNPALRVIPVNAEISSREKAIIATLYAEVVKNLELSKTLLSQETPTIEIVDKSSLPLKKIKWSKLKSFVIGVVLALSLMIFYLFLSRSLRNISINHFNR
jgi:hypothetical protein